jgi:hypothetical protein
MSTEFYDYDRPKFRRTHYLFMMRDEAHSFSQQLREALPNIRFVSHDYWKPFIDWAAYEQDLAERERRGPENPPEHHLVYRMRDPRGGPLHYWDSFGTAEEDSFLAWLEPRGWKPRWTEPDDRGIRWLKNIPLHSFAFHRSGFCCRSRDLSVFPDPPAPLDENETIILEGQRLEIRWHHGDETGEHLAKTGFRILSKLTVDRFYDVEIRSRRAFPKPFHRPAFYRAGREAADWACSRRHNYLADSTFFYKPADFVFSPADIFTEEQLAAREARLDDEFEKLRIRHEAELAAEFAEEFAKRRAKPRAPRKRKQ